MNVIDSWRDVIQVDQTSADALFLQVKSGLGNWIRNGLRDGMLSPGDRVPSEHELSEALNVSGITVKRALNELQQEGVIQRIQGRGSFIAKPRRIILGLERLYSITTAAQKSGMASTSQTLELKVIPATANIARELRIAQNEDIAKLVRLRLIDGQPLAVDTSYMPLVLFPTIMDMDFDQVSLYEFMANDYGIEPIRAREFLEPVLINEFEAQILEVPQGSPAMLIERIAYGTGDIPVEFNKGVIRGDRCRFSVDMLKQNL